MPREYASLALSGPAKYLVCSKVFSRAKIWWPVKVGRVCFFLWMVSLRGSGAGRGKEKKVSRVSRDLSCVFHRDVFYPEAPEWQECGDICQLRNTSGIPIIVTVISTTPGWTGPREGSSTRL